MYTLDKLGPSVADDRDSYPALVSYAGPPQQPLQSIPPYPPIQRKVRKVGAPLGVIIALGTIAGLIVIVLTAFNPVGTVDRVRAVQRRDDGRRAGLPVAGPVGAGTAAAAGPRVPLGRVGRRHHRVDTAARRRGRHQPGRDRNRSARSPSCSAHR